MPQGAIILSGTVSHGTLNTRDLLRSFADELERVSSDHARLVSEARHNVSILSIPSCNDRDRIIAADVLSDLFDALDSVASEHGLTFGAHPGDGSDFGYWEPEED